MQATTHQRVLAIAGVLWAALIVAAVVLTGDQPSNSDSVATVFNYWHDNQSSEIAAAVIGQLAAVLIVLFGAGVRSALRSGEAGEATYSVIAFGGAVVAAAGFAVAGMVNLAGAAAADQGAHGAVYTINQLNAASWIPFTAGLALIMLAAGIGGLRTLALPRWLSWVGIALGVAFMTPAGALGFILVPFWVVAVSVALYRRPSDTSGAAAGVPHPAA